MTKEEYSSFLLKKRLTQEKIKFFLDRTLLSIEDSRDYADCARRFCIENNIKMNHIGRTEVQFLHSLIGRLFAWRVKKGALIQAAELEIFLPIPSDFAILEAERYAANAWREFYYRSDKRRGFYKKGERTYDCGTDLQDLFFAYEYETKGKKT